MPAPVGNAFAGLSLVLDRKSERRNDGAWVAAQAAAATTRFLLLDAEQRAFVRAGEDVLRWLDGAERARLCRNAPAWLLGIAGGRAHFVIELDETADALALERTLGARRASLREAAANLPVDEAALFAYAKGLAHWHHETRHCAFCGALLATISAGHRMRCTNTACARLHFPRTDAAIIVLVEHAGACLLGRQSTWAPGRYSTLAGFVEPGEALEDAVRREVGEESGVLVDSTRYHSSQPWPMPASLMVAFTATARSTAITLRDHELEDARWFTPRDIAAGIADGSFVPSSAISVSYHLLADWLRAHGGMELGELVAARAAVT